MSHDIKILTVTPDLIGRILIIRGDFRYADEIFGDAPVAALPASAVAAAAPAQSAPGSQPGVVPKDFPLLANEKSVDACARWVTHFLTVDRPEGATMNDIRDYVPTSIQALYSHVNSARNAVTTATKKLVDENVLSAPDGFDRKSVVTIAPASGPAVDTSAEQDAETVDAVAETIETPVAATVAEATPEPEAAPVADQQPVAETAPVAEAPAASSEKVEAQALTPGESTLSEAALLGAEDFFSLDVSDLDGASAAE